VWRILKRLKMSRLPAHLSQRCKRLDKRWQRYEKQLPRNQVQIDVKLIAPIAGATRLSARTTSLEDPQNKRHRTS
jgi:hypothetical protein